CRGLEGGERTLYGGDGLLAGRDRGLQYGLRCVTAVVQRLLAVEIGLGPNHTGLRGFQLCLRLIDLAVLGCDLLADALDRRLLGADASTYRVDRDPVVAVIDSEDDVAGLDL